MLGRLHIAVVELANERLQLHGKITCTEHQILLSYDYIVETMYARRTYSNPAYVT